MTPSRQLVHGSMAVLGFGCGSKQMGISFVGTRLLIRSFEPCGLVRNCLFCGERLVAEQSAGQRRASVSDWHGDHL